VKIILSKCDSIVLAFPVWILRQVDILTVDHQIRHIKGQAPGIDLHIPDAEPVHPTGIPVGGALAYTDEATLQRAFEYRRQY